MSDIVARLIIRRGKLADLPRLSEGELGFATDEGVVYIGGKDGNIELANDAALRVIKESLEEDIANVPDHSSEIAGMNTVIESLQSAVEGIQVPDYSGELSEINSTIESIQESIANIPDHSEELTLLYDSIESLETYLDELPDHSGDIGKLDDRVTSVESVVDSIPDYSGDINTINEKLVSVESSIESIPDHAGDIDSINEKVSTIESSIGDIPDFSEAIQSIESRLGDLESNGGSGGGEGNSDFDPAAFKKLQDDVNRIFPQLATFIMYDELDDLNFISGSQGGIVTAGLLFASGGMLAIEKEPGQFFHIRIDENNNVVAEPLEPPADGFDDPDYEG